MPNSAEHGTLSKPRVDFSSFYEQENFHAH